MTRAKWDPHPAFYHQSADLLLALILIGEAASLSIHGRVAVAAVVRNRVLRTQQAVDALGPPENLWTKILLKPWAFSCLTPLGGPVNNRSLVELAVAVVHDQEPDTVSWREAKWVARGMMAGDLRDPTKGATHYHTVTLDPKPSWARPALITVNDGAHVFYRLDDPRFD